jgi:zinc/manganese transport system substrate-binding protein
MPASVFIVALSFAAYVAASLRPRRMLLAPATALLLLGTVGCGLPNGAGGATGGSKIEVVAAESFWGSIAQQVAGTRAQVTSIVANPATDPHDYEPAPADARLIATARYVIVNGAGYDSWASQLIDANPVEGRRVLDVAGLLGKKNGDNPHFWYSPDYVTRVARRIASDLGAVASGDAFVDDSLGAYRSAIGAIRQEHSGTKIGATESLFAYLAPALGLDLITPRGYMDAIAEGSNPTVADKAAAEAQAANRQITVLVFNSQNATPDVDALVAKARAAGVPVVPMTETPPVNTSFQDWQTAQLQALLAALGG